MDLNRTLDYYDRKASDYCKDTVSADMSDQMACFLSRLPEKAAILDFGCGSGRDTKVFLEKGYHVDAVDGSEELCRAASAYTGIQVRKMLFSELEKIDHYDGIWACASILHLSKHDLKNVFQKMAAAVKKDGVIYTCFKYGTFEGYRGERFYTDFTEESIKKLISCIPELNVNKCWITADVRRERGEEKWINVLLSKN